MNYSGSVTVQLVEDRVVVLEADPYVLVSVELVRDWRANPDNCRVRLHGNRVTFGTRGEGVGEVTYALGEMPDEPLLTFGPPERFIETPSVPMRRVS